MKKAMIAFVLILISIGFAACSPADNRGYQKEVPVQVNSTKASSYTNIKPEDAKKRLSSEKGIILLDVRTQEEYDEKHIPNSLLIPVDVIEKEAPEKLTDKNTTIFVYCRSGRRSVTASEALAKMGYKKVYNLGGIIDWPYETETGR
ncbi:MAG TPA: rhodanese-like domain-containing protein [Pseudobacteroides sp.]|uniref:rhodanese-like domain-containing protein n=1 Tax=Pseudobacteroides sp. TaxID=1968840 RepID=UPI002F934071